MSAPKRKFPQSVIIKLRIEGINIFELSFTFIYSKERVYELTECQKDINSGSGSSSKSSTYLSYSSLFTRINFQYSNLDQTILEL